jgi:hypothetical protein
LLADDLAQTHRVGVRYRHHNLAVRIEDAQNVEPLARSRDVPFVDTDDFSNTLRGVDSLVTDFELNFRACLHVFSLSRASPE